MKITLKLKLIGFIGILFFCQSLTAQQVSNVSFELVDQDINIYYTLSPISSDNFEISVVLMRTSIPSFSYNPPDLSGDYGEGKYAGTNRKIVWHVSDEEMNMFDGDDFYFEVFAEKIEKSGGIPWYYYVGTAALGGAAAVLLGGGSGSDNTTPTPQSFPTPPDRP